MVGNVFASHGQGDGADFLQDLLEGLGSGVVEKRVGDLKDDGLVGWLGVGTAIWRDDGVHGVALGLDELDEVLHSILEFPGVVAELFSESLVERLQSLIHIGDLEKVLNEGLNAKEEALGEKVSDAGKWRSQSLVEGLEERLLGGGARGVASKLSRDRDALQARPTGTRTAPWHC